MNWRVLQEQVAERSGVPVAKVRLVLQCAMALAEEALLRGEEVPLRGIGTLSTRWKAPRVVRSVTSHRKLRIDGRYVPRFQPSRSLRTALLGRSDQAWRDPAHQEAWRMAETLVSDLDLYHPEKAPQLSREAPHEEVRRLCVSSFGRLWQQAEARFDAAVPEPIRLQNDYLAQAALARWGHAATARGTPAQGRTSTA